MRSLEQISGDGRRRVALVTGVGGQDGSYAAEQLLGDGFRVVGTTRDIARTRPRLPLSLRDSIELVACSLEDDAEIERLLKRAQPDEVYNFAAFSSGAGMYDDPVGIGRTNGLAVARFLEAIRRIDTRIKFCQASSSELFGLVETSPQHETTIFRPRSPYGSAKLYAHSMIDIYRQRYGLFACSAILFNHESPRRGLDFVTRKITDAAVRVKFGLAMDVTLGDLNARRDWGFAGDYVQAMRRMLRVPEAGDYVVATGETHSVRDLCSLAFGYLGLDYRAHVRETPDGSRARESHLIVGDASKARRILGWSPTIGFEALIHTMVDADLRRHEAVRANSR